MQQTVGGCGLSVSAKDANDMYLLLSGSDVPLNASSFCNHKKKIHIIKKGLSLGIGL